MTKERTRKKEARVAELDVDRTLEKNLQSDKEENSPSKISETQESINEDVEVTHLMRCKTPENLYSESGTDSSGSSPAKRLKKRKKRERESLRGSSPPSSNSPTKSEESVFFDDEPYSKAVKLFRIDNEYLNLDKIKEDIMELEEAAEKFAKRMNNIDIPIKWEIPDTLKAKKGISKTKYKDVLLSKLSNEEIECLNARLQKFCKRYKLKIEDIKFLSGNRTSYKMSNQMRLRFIQYLGRDLKDRAPRTLYSYLCRLGLRRGKFTKEEDDLIIDIYNNYTGPNFYSLCGRLLNRHKFNIYKHFRYLKKVMNIGPKQKILPKTTGNTEKKSDDVLKSIVYRMKKKNLKIVSSNISTNSWKGIGNENNISPALAKAIFLCDLSPRLYTVGPIHYHKLCMDLINRIDRGSLSWDCVPWSLIAAKFKGFNKFSIYCLFRSLVEKYVPKKSWHNLRDCIGYLESKLLSTSEKTNECEDYILKKIELVD